MPWENDHRLVTISGGAVVSDSAINMAAPQHTFTPILQAEDGTYFGTGVSSQYSMGAFDLSGNVKWSVPNFTPVMATADGGLIAGGPSGYVTFDQNGVANGQLASLPTYAWIGTAYQNQSVVNQVSIVPADYAESYDAVVGGNQSSNGAFIKENPFPLMKGCYNPSNNTLCAYDSLLEALSALQIKVDGTCADCDHWVFNKIAGGPSNDQQVFSRFIKRRPRFFNGTKSTLNTVYLSGDFGSLDALKMYAKNAQGNTRIGNLFTQYPQLIAVAVLMPTIAHDPNGEQGLEIFFSPSKICTVYGSPDTPSQIWVQSLLFHEGLHNFYGLSDASIQTNLGLPVTPCTQNIADYVSFTIYGLSVNSCGP